MLDSIEFTAQGVAMPAALDADETRRWLAAVAATHNRRIGALTYIFCSDDRILEVNKQYLRHDYYTDIITFDYCRGRMLSGDMFISLDTVRSNAEMLGVDPDRELYRVVVHGLLHLCGINDKGPGERAIMERAEDDALSLLNNL
jgi:rRNA maturation RNase YbeY